MLIPRSSADWPTNHGFWALTDSCQLLPYLEQRSCALVEISMDISESHLSQRHQLDAREDASWRCTNNCRAMYSCSVIMLRSVTGTLMIPIPSCPWAIIHIAFESCGHSWQNSMWKMLIILLYCSNCRELGLLFSLLRFLTTVKRNEIVSVQKKLQLTKLW